jgi:ribonuclease PH
VALFEACEHLRRNDRIAIWPVRELVAGVSVGVVDGEALLDLAYGEDSRAEVDMNIVLTAGGRFVELQGTAESEPFDETKLSAMLALARKGAASIFESQREALGLGAARG